MSQPIVCSRAVSCSRALSMHLSRAATALPRLHARRWPATGCAPPYRLHPSRLRRALYSTGLPRIYGPPENWREHMANFNKSGLDMVLRVYFEPEHLHGVEKEADNQRLKPDAPWGLAVYRTCYDDEAKWQWMREHLETEVRESPEDINYARESIFGRHRLAFKDDKTLFDGAGLAKVREHFEQWAKEELERNWAQQSVTDEMRADLYEPPGRPAHGYIHSAGTPYHICIVIDDICLLSLDEDRVGPLIMLVNKRPGGWDVTTEDEDDDDDDDDEEVHPDYEDGWMSDRLEGPGGWIYVRLEDYINHYDILHEVDCWGEDFMFMYPSYVYGDMGLERSPAFWREEGANKKD